MVPTKLRDSAWCYLNCNITPEIVHPGSTESAHVKEKEEEAYNEGDIVEEGKGNEKEKRIQKV